MKHETFTDVRRYTDAQMFEKIYGPTTNIVDVFDFDGVVAEPLEEALFTMPATIHDPEFIRVMCDWLGIDLRSESAASARYICLQGALKLMEFQINPGPLFWKVGVNPFHIMTARCDRFAVARVHQFIGEKGLKPIKIMHTDHLPKGQMLKVMLERHPDTHFNFYDDNPRHIESAKILNNPRLSVFKVDNDMEPFYTLAHKLYHSQILERFL